MKTGKVQCFATFDEITKTSSKYVEYYEEKNLVHAAEVLSGKFLDSSELKSFEDVLFVFDKESKIVSFNQKIIELCRKSKKSELIKTWINDLIQYSLIRYSDEFGGTDYGFPFLKLYQTYSMRDVAPLCNYQKTHSSFRGQGLLTAAKPDYFLFVNLHKDKDIKDSINYADKFITQNAFQWQSPNSTSQDSEIGQNLINNVERKINLHLFVRKFEKVENITQPFMYLGKVVTFPESAKGNKPITMTFTLENKVPDEVFADFQTRTDI